MRERDEFVCVCVWFHSSFRFTNIINGQIQLTGCTAIFKH